MTSVVRPPCSCLIISDTGGLSGSLSSRLWHLQPSQTIIAVKAVIKRFFPSLIYVEPERIEKTLSAVPRRRGPIFLTRLHLLRLHYDPVTGTWGCRHGAKVWHTQQTAVTFSGTDIGLAFWNHCWLLLLFHQGFVSGRNNGKHDLREIKEE